MVDHDSAGDVLREHLSCLKTEPMTIARLQDYFVGVNRQKLLRIVRAMADVEDIGGGWYRLPIARMPPAYYVDVGLVPTP